MDYDEVIVNEHYRDEITEEIVNRILNKPGKLTPRDLDTILEYYGMSLSDLVNRIRSRQHSHQENLKRTGRTEVVTKNMEPNESYTTITIPLLCNESPTKKATSSPKKRTSSSGSKSKSSKKKRHSSRPKVSFSTVKKIIGKKKFTSTDLKKLAHHYNVSVKNAIPEVWFAAAKKGHLLIMKELYKNGHVRDLSMTNRKGITAEEIAEDNRRGHIARWLTSTTTKKVPIGDESDYHFRQAYSDDSYNSSDSD